MSINEGLTRYRTFRSWGEGRFTVEGLGLGPQATPEKSFVGRVAGSVRWQ